MAFRQIVSLISALILSATAAGTLAAQADTTRTAGDTLRARAFLLPPVVVLAARTPVRPERVGFAIGAVLPDELALRRPRTAADALRESSGAFIEEAAGAGGPTIVRLRGGEEVFTQILMDGVQINENGGFFDFQGLVPSNIERIEVARGPQSALYGSSAVSGVVGFVTPRGTAGPTRWSAYGEGSVAAENGGAWRTTADASGGTDAFAYSVGAGAAYARGIFDEPHDTKSRDASLRLDARPARGLELTGTARWLAMEGKLPVRDPGATRVPLDPNALNERDRIVSALTGRWTSPSGRTSQQLRAALYHEDFFFADQRDNVTDVIGEQPFFIFDADFTFDSRRSRTTLEYAGSLAPGETSTLSWGAQWERETVRDITGGDFGDGRLSLDRNSRAAFAELLVSPNARVDLLAGVRVEKYEDIDAAWTPRASLVFAAVPGTLSLRAAAGRAFKAPNLQQQFLDNPFIRANPDLVPETSTSWEAGFDTHTAGGRGFLALTFFRQTYHDLIRTVAVEGSQTGQQINRNLGESRAQGLEWDAAWRATGAWTLGARGAWIGTEIVDGVGLNPAEYPVGESLPFRPSVVHTVYVETRAVDRLDARVAATHVGAQDVLTERFSGRRERLDAYVQVGVALRYALSETIALHGRIENLFDAEYATGFDRRGQPFNVAVGVRVGT